MSMPLIYALFMACIGIYMVKFYSITLNKTPSETIGYYLLLKNYTIQRNNIYQICLINKQNNLQIMHKLGLSKSTSCKNGYTPLLKPVVGMPNDIIYITKYGVVINNHLLQNSVARLR